jgi:hypothetical protein
MLAVPGDPRELAAQLRTAARLKGLDPGDAAEEVGAEVGHARAILGGGSAPSGVVEGRLELVVLAACDVGVLVDDDATDPLPRGAGGDGGLAVLTAKPSSRAIVAIVARMCSPWCSSREEPEKVRSSA